MGQLKIKYLPVDQIKPYEKNPRYNDSAVSKVADSIKEFGWQQPIVIDKDNVIVAGHTRYKAAQLLKINSVPVVVASDLSPKQIKAYRIADNKVSDFAIWDNKTLLEELGDIGEDVFTGFDIGGLFDDVLDESDNTPVEENKSGVTYEIVLRSENKEIVERMKELWEQVCSEYEQDTCC